MVMLRPLLALLAGLATMVLLVVVVTATLVARTLDPRSIYDARLTDQEIDEQIQDRRPAPT